MTQGMTQTMPPVGDQPADKPKNMWGLIGFILSLVAFITCGALSIVSLIVSVVGLFKKPKGFAIAGTVLSLVGLLVLVLVGGGMIAAFLGLKSAGGVMQQGIALGFAQEGIVSFYAQEGRLPDEAELSDIIDTRAAQAPDMFGPDGLQVEYEYEVVDDQTARITFPGFDGQLGTSDDISELIDVAGP